MEGTERNNRHLFSFNDSDTRINTAIYNMLDITMITLRKINRQKLTCVNAKSANNVIKKEEVWKEERKKTIVVGK